MPARLLAGGLASEAARRPAQFAKALRMDADEAGEIIVRGIERRQPRIPVGRDAKAVALIERLMPVGYWRLLASGRA